MNSWFEKHRLNKKRVAGVALVVVVFVVGFFAYRSMAKEDEPQYQTSKVTRGMIISSVSASGKITGVGNVSVTTQATGVIKKICVKEGDYVEKGDKLFEIELDRDGELNKAKAWASYLSAKSDLESARQNQLAAGRDVLSANMDLSSAEQSKLSLQRELTLANSSLSAAEQEYEKAKDGSASVAELKQKELSLLAAQDALALAQSKYDNALNGSGLTEEQNLLALKRELELTKAALASAQDAYDAAVDDTSTTSSFREQKLLALEAAQDAVTLAQSKYDNAGSSNATSTQQSKLALQRELTLANAALVAAQQEYNNAKRNAASDAELKQKELALEAAKDALALAQTKYDGAGDAIERAELGVTIAEQKAGSGSSAIEKAEVNVEVARLAYEATLPVVRAPVNGKIDNMMVVVGMTVSGSSSSSSGGSSSASSGSTSGSSGAGNGSSGASSGSSSGSSSSKLATIITGSTPTGEFSVSEMDVVKVKKGQKVTITVDALPDKTFTGKVIGVNKSGSVSSGVTTYPATVQIDTDSESLLPNMVANANIITETKDNVLLIPAGASRTSGNQSTVTVLRNGQAEQVAVELGLTSETSVEVISGLAEGDEIVLSTLSSQSSGTQAAGSSPFSSSGGFGGNRSIRGGGGFSGGFGGGMMIAPRR